MEQELQPFEQSSNSKRFRVTAHWQIKDGALHLRSECRGPVGLLDFDPSSSPQAADALWKKTCFECFLLKANSTEYVEWNFSPSGDFQRYQFLSYRQRSTVASAPTTTDFDIQWSTQNSQFSATLKLPLPFDTHKIQVSWVLKPTDAETMFWALKHPSTKPDFHHADSFENVGVG